MQSWDSPRVLDDHITNSSVITGDPLLPSTFHTQSFIWEFMRQNNWPNIDFGALEKYIPNRLPRNTGSKNEIRVHESRRPTTMTACQSLSGTALGFPVRISMTAPINASRTETAGPVKHLLTKQEPVDRDLGCLPSHC
jgi:hypothetical protein